LEKIRVGFIGCGGIAAAHLKGLVKNPHVELAAFCDINPERAKSTARRFGAHRAAIYSDAEKMLRETQLDCLYFCLPPYAHGAELHAVDHGIPFFVEKPIGLSLELAEEIASAVQRKNLLTSVGYMNRYRRSVQTARQALSRDTPVLVLGGWIGRTPQPTPQATIWRWWIIKEKSGGQFHEQVTHTVDLARYLCGEIVEVHAIPAKGLNPDTPPGYNIEDAAVVNIRFANGAVGNLWACCAANAGGGGVTLSIYANKTTALFTGWEHSLRLLQAGSEPLEIPGEPNIFEIEDNAFIDAVRLNDPSKILCPYSDALETLRVTLAANQSMETGEPVKVRA